MAIIENSKPLKIEFDNKNDTPQQQEYFKNKEQVDHPTHYNSHPSGVETIEIVRHHSFNIGNVIKYVWRAGLKDEDTELEDLKKALWYLQDEIKTIEKQKQS